MKHQYDFDQGNMADSHTKPSSASNPSEIRAINVENIARKIENLPKGTKYGGVVINPEKLK